MYENTKKKKIVCIHLLSLPFCTSLNDLETNKKKNISHRNHRRVRNFLCWLRSQLAAVKLGGKNHFPKTKKKQNCKYFCFFKCSFIYKLMTIDIYIVNFSFVTWYGRKLKWYFFIFLYIFFLNLSIWLESISLFHFTYNIIIRTEKRLVSWINAFLAPFQ